MKICDYCRSRFEASEMKHVRQYNVFTEELTCEYDVCPNCGCNEVIDESQMRKVSLDLTPTEYSWLFGMIENTTYLGEAWELSRPILKQLVDQENTKA